MKRTFTAVILGQGLCVMLGASRDAVTMGASGVVGMMEVSAKVATECTQCEGCEPWGDWVPCDGGWQYRQSHTCAGVREQRECEDSSAECGPWTNWIPTDLECVKGNMQERHRHSCPTLEETKVCLGFTCSLCHINANCNLDDASCICKTGYEGSGYYCSDVNECEEDPGICGANATCSNRGGSHLCTCLTGFAAPSGGPSRDYPCENINECLGTGWSCDPNATCRDTNASYACDCNVGWKAAGTSCVDDDLCERKTDCQAHSTCVEILGGTDVECRCIDGWELSSTQDDTCVDINECPDGINTAACATDDNGGICTNQDGHYTCSCKAGWTLRNDVECEDNNECTDGTARCDTSVGSCTNEPGSHSCSCNAGYTLNADGFTCDDIDECAQGACGAHADCVNGLGGHTCTCHDGYAPPDGDKDIALDNQCEDINECNGGHNCSAHATCTNREPFFECDCMTGYSGNGVVCSADKCHELHNPCDDLAECSVDDATQVVTCTCAGGYRGDGFVGNCTDINECTETPDICGTGASCENEVPGKKCTCLSGYVKDSCTGKCVDVNECKTGKDDCGANTDCINDTPDYHCEAHTGFELDPSGLTASDINECDLNTHNCRDNSDCFNTEGSFRCDCHTGFGPATLENDYQVCHDKNECTIPTHNCDSNAVCTNHDGYYTCTCNCAYQGDGFSGNCIDIRYCDSKTCSENATCSEAADHCSAVCTCDGGYSGEGEGVDGCVDDNECDDNPCTDHAACTNIPGSYTCACITGYRMVAGICEEINECSEGTDTCDSTNGTCTNSPAGSYTCACNTGWEWTGTRDMDGSRVCVDQNECSGNYVNKCPQGDQYSCVNGQGSFECHCIAGFEKNSDDLCVDIDECDASINPPTCAAHANCENLRGGHQCNCHSGYAVMDVDAENPGHAENPCEEVNECLSDLHDCDDNAICDNEPGTWLCTCKDGYSGDGKSCVDVDLCSATENPCHPKAYCTENEDNSAAECDCWPGYDGNGVGATGCIPVNECLDPAIHGCDSPENGGKCIDQTPMWSCSCELGYELQPDKTCQDTNECLDRNLSGCSAAPAGKCDNAPPGSHTCGCNEGWELQPDGTTCLDIDECALGSHNCGANSTCHNTEPNYECTCHTGYDVAVAGEPNPGHIGNPCMDINECLEDICDTNATCHNDPGTHRCICNTGWIGNGTTCADREWCENKTCPTHSSCHETEANDGHECRCDSGYSGETGLEPTCENIDECHSDTHPHQCPDVAGMYCHDSDGSYECLCRSGWTKQGAICVDINECETGDNLCDSIRGGCENDDGSYDCTCKTGYRLNVDGHACDDILECTETVGDGSETPVHQCSANSVCIEGIGSYTCECDEGYESTTGMKGNPCTNIDECKIGDHTCGSTDVATCHDTAGSYTCTCNTGYYMENDVCVAYDWCANNTCHEEAACHVLPKNAGYQCICGTGWSGSGEPVELGCIDDNECEDAQIHKCTSSSGDRCENTPGSWNCFCAEGYERDEHDVCVDIDECAVDPTLCDRINGSCVNEIARGRCTCNTGYALQADDSCIDIDECADATKNNCHVGEGAHCRDLEGSFECYCDAGFTGNGVEACADIDECVTGPSECLAHSSCHNYTGGHRCTCDAGYASAVDNLETRGKQGNACEDINECEDDSHQCTANVGHCHNNGGSYTCTCDAGYELKGLHSCVDIDWCGSSPCHPNATCSEINNGATFECACETGWENTPGEVAGVGPNGCRDVNECVEHREWCAAETDGGICTNDEGTYACSCEVGFTQDGNKCNPIYECQDAALNDCAPEGSVCIEERNGFSCDCLPGWTGTGVVCDDINECEDTLATCGPNAICINSPGGHTCTTKDGYECPDPESPPSPENPAGNINECALATTNECNTTKARCDDLSPTDEDPRKYKCTCNDGYEGNGIICNMKDACETGSINCLSNSECEEVGDGINYNCVCVDGWVGDGKTECINVDECTDYVETIESGPICHANSTCSDTQGSYECVCNSGFRQEGTVCLDNDECTANTHDCDTDSTVCFNKPGGFDCNCLGGYQPNDTLNSCDDINECSPVSPCSDPGICTNTGGTYVCSCECGFTGQGTPEDPCIDVDEEKVGGHDCSTNATVHNTIGSWTCICNTGYRGDGKTCDNIDYCAEAVIPPHVVCQEIDHAPVMSCQTGYIVAVGATLETDGCVDHDECTDDSFTTTCATLGSSCHNGDGSYTCSCLTGFTGNGHECIDDDECEVNYGGCTLAELGGRCINEPGGHRCDCLPGRSLAADGVTCDDINECTDSSDDCLVNSSCFNTPGSFTCPCNPGWSGDGGRPGSPCNNVDECANSTHACRSPAVCADNQGGYDCTCPPGWESTADELGCDWIDPCIAANCHVDAECVPLPDGLSATCVCHDGHEGDGVNGSTECTDIDECTDGGSDCAIDRSVCSNTKGSWTCACSPGFNGTGQTCDDINECTQSTPCASIAHSVCVNTIGEYECQCVDHFEKVDGVCRAIDYCAEPEKTCGINGLCYPMENGEGYSCGCPVGMESLGQGRGCRAVQYALACRDWQPWTACVVNMPTNSLIQTPVQTRACTDMASYTESRECAHDPNKSPTDECGGYSPWSECETWTTVEGYQYSYQHRSRQHKDTREGCDLYEERRDCLRHEAQVACEPLGAESMCGVPSTGMSYRMFENCPWYYQLQHCTVGDEDNRPEAEPIEEGDCVSWSAWGSCQMGTQTRVCGDWDANGKTETRICDPYSVPVCGDWSLWSDCDENGLTFRVRDGCGVREVAECGAPATQPDVLEACGAYSEWGSCGNMEGNPVQMRIMGVCPYYDMAACQLETPIPEGSPMAEETGENGRFSCTDWGPWSPCEEMTKTHQTRNCISHSVQEKRECPLAAAPTCGDLSAWSDCESGVQTRHRQACPEMVEVLLCNSRDLWVTCGGSPSDWGVCGASMPLRQIRRIGDCNEYEVMQCTLVAEPADAGEAALVQVRTSTDSAMPVEEAQDIISNFTSVCDAWMPWSPCNDDQERARVCDTMPDLTETMGCDASGICGDMLPWTELDENTMTRHREGCPEPAEVMQKTTIEEEASCGRWGSWGTCDAVSGHRYRTRAECLEGCTCLEQEECEVEEPVAPVIPVIPENPEIPEIPVLPENPDLPEVPEIPEVPVDPDSPIGQLPGVIIPGIGDSTTTTTTKVPSDGTSSTTVAPVTSTTTVKTPTEESEVPPTDTESGTGEKSESADGGGAAIAGGIIGAVVIGAGVGGLAFYGSKSKAGTDDETVEIEETGVEGAAELSEQEEVIEFEEDAWAEDV